LLIGALALIALALSAQRVSTSYAMYMRQQMNRLAMARADAAVKLAQVRTDSDVVFIAAINETGGTFHVYIGETGALQNLGGGVQTVAPPVEVLTVAPHQNGPLIVHNWRHKYITSQTTYVWLTPTSLPPIGLMDADYSVGQDGRAIMIYRAIPNGSDQNYHMTMMSPLPLQQSGSNIAAQEDRRIRDFEQRLRVNESHYPTSFRSYAAAKIAQLTGIRFGANP
jgi:hypothetical protein